MRWHLCKSLPAREGRGPPPAKSGGSAETVVKPNNRYKRRMKEQPSRVDAHQQGPKRARCRFLIPMNLVPLSMGTTTVVARERGKMGNFRCHSEGAPPVIPILLPLSF